MVKSFDSNENKEAYQVAAVAHTPLAAMDIDYYPIQVLPCWFKIIPAYVKNLIGGV